ncbi:hypothetical protein, partial [Streptomyces harbinensis]
MHASNGSAGADETTGRDLGRDRDDNHDTPSDTLPPRRRRRAASRPAGPPAATDNETTASQVAPASGDSAGQTSEPAGAGTATGEVTRGASAADTA